MGIAFPYHRSHGGGREQDLAGGDATASGCARQQHLGDDALEDGGKLGAHQSLLRWGEDVDDAVDGLRGIAGVDGGKDEMPRLARGQGELNGLQVPHFTDEDDVGVFA